MVATDLVADAADCADERVVCPGINFAPQVVDVHVHHVGDGIAVSPPNFLDDCRAGYWTSGIPQQEFQQGVFLGAELDGAAGTAHSASNTVSNVINGVTLNLGSPSPSTPVTVNVNPDTTQVTSAINTLVSAYNTVITEINSQFNVAADGSGGGPLETDNSLREVQSQLLGALSNSISGISGIVNLASIGVNFNNDGTLSVDSGKLASTLSSNFSAVQNLLPLDRALQHQFARNGHSYPRFPEH